MTRKRQTTFVIAGVDGLNHIGLEPEDKDDRHAWITVCGLNQSGLGVPNFFEEKQKRDWCPDCLAGRP